MHLVPPLSPLQRRLDAPHHRVIQQRTDLRGRRYLAESGPGLLHVLQGAVTLDLGDRQFTLPANTRCTLQAGPDVSMTAATRRACVYVAIVRDDSLNQHLAVIEEARFDEPSTAIRSEADVESDLAVLTASMADCMRRLPGNLRAASGLLARLVDARNAVFADPHTSTRAMASDAALSYGHFIGCFRAAFGISPGEFVTRQKLRMVKTYLTDDYGTLPEIAERCGYEDRSAMSRAFKRQYGVAPAIYRREQASDLTH